MTNSKPSTVRNYFPILLVMLIWGSMGIPSTYAVEEFTPLTVLCLRSGIALIVLFPATLHRYGSVCPAPGEGKLLVLLSLIGVVLCNYLYFSAVKNTLLTNVAILYALGPIITTVLAVIFLKERAFQSRYLGIALAFIGGAVLITNGNLKEILSLGSHWGDLAQLGSSLCLAIYTIFSKKIRKTPAECVVFWLMLIAFLTTLPMVYLFEGGIPFPVNRNAIFSIAYLGILCSGMGYLLQQQSIKKIGASASAAFLNGISPITILTAAVILKEPISLLQALCILVVFLGLFLNACNKNLFSRKAI